MKKRSIIETNGRTSVMKSFLDGQVASSSQPFIAWIDFHRRITPWTVIADILPRQFIKANKSHFCSHYGCCNRPTWRVQILIVSPLVRPFLSCFSCWQPGRIPLITASHHSWKDAEQNKCLDQLTGSLAKSVLTPKRKQCDGFAMHRACNLRYSRSLKIAIAPPK